MIAPKNSILGRMNPSVKLMIVFILTIVLTLSYNPLLQLTFLVAAFIVVCAAGRISPARLLRMMAPFFLLALCLTGMLLLLRNISWNEGLQVTVSSSEVKIASSLGIRIAAITLFSMAFVVTTDPVLFVISLIQNLKVPDVVGYATLTAYRFVPTLKDEAEKIRLAQQVRGLETGTGILRSVFSARRMLIPLLITAIRKGERVAIAMESRAFGAYPKRSYYIQTKITRYDALSMVYTGLFTAIVLLLFQISGGLDFGVHY